MVVKANQLRIVNYPHPTLRAKAAPIEQVDDSVRQVAERMLELMHAAQGVGLAAPQVALPWRMFVANPTGDPADDRVYINPVLSEASDHTALHEEGCLSLPHVTGQIMRPEAITITALDSEGNQIAETANDLSARIWQHETDHLDGVLIIDRMRPVDRQANQRALRALEEAFNPVTS